MPNWKLRTCFFAWLGFRSTGRHLHLLSSSQCVKRAFRRRRNLSKRKGNTYVQTTRLQLTRALRRHEDVFCASSIPSIDRANENDRDWPSMIRPIPEDQTLGLYTGYRVASQSNRCSTQRYGSTCSILGQWIYPCL
jgi:hypothetical protein